MTAGHSDIVGSALDRTRSEEARASLGRRARRVLRILGESLRAQAGYAGGTTTRADIRAIREMLRSGESILRGPHIAQFEVELGAFLGSPFVTSYGAGRMALFVLLKAMGLKDDSEVILPGYNCIVIPNAIRFAGLRPVYVDIRESDLNVDPELIERAITPRTRAVIVQHSFGVPADMDAMGDICRRHGLPLIEDCAHALGAELDGRKLGTIGYAGFYSTEATKMFSTEKGGILVTADPELGRRIQDLHAALPFREEAYERLMAKRFAVRPWAEHGSLRFPVVLLRILDVKLGFRRLCRIEHYDAEDYAAELSGRRAEPYPCRLSNIMSLAGIRQLERIDEDLAHRRMLANELERILPAKGARVLRYDRLRSRPSWVRFPFLVDDPAAWRKRISSCGLEPGAWLNDPCHPRGSNHEFVGYRRGSCPVAEHVSQRILNVPVHSRIRLGRILRLERV